MKTKKNQTPPRWKKVVPIFILFALLFLLGFLLPILVDPIFSVGEMDPGELVFMLAGILIIVYVATVIHIILHEAGHLIFGRLTGYQFSSFRIGSFMWVKQEGKIKFRKMSIAGTGGQCLMVPPRMKEGKIPFVLYNLGGVIVNMIAAALFIVLFFITRSLPILSTFFFIMAAMGVLLAAFNGIPMQFNTITNDGYNGISLGKNPQALHSFWIQMKINEQVVKGKRLKEMPEEWFVIPNAEAMKNSMVAAIGVFACNRMMDLMEMEKADKQMAELLKMDTGMVGVHRKLLIADRIYCILTCQNHPESIDNLMNEEQKSFMKYMKRFPSVLRTQYAMALLSENDVSKAQNYKDEFEKVAKTYPHKGDVEADRELMTYALEVYHRKNGKNPDDR